VLNVVPLPVTHFLSSSFLLPFLFLSSSFLLSSIILTHTTTANAVVDLQTQMARERSEAIRGVETAMKGVYPQVDPPLIFDLCERTTTYFKRVVDLKKLAADATNFFPTEFDSADPKEIRRSFLIAKREAEEEDA
jgi:hypothetical protein